MDREIKKTILDQLQIDESVYDEILEEFARDVLRQAAELKGIFLRHDAAAAKKVLHSLKGMAENLRVKKMIVLIDALRGFAGREDAAQALEKNLGLLEDCARDIENAF